MSIFGKIMDAIFGKAKAEGGAPGTPRRDRCGRRRFDVGGRCRESGLRTWRRRKKKSSTGAESIVDLMKVLDLDSSLKSRQALAKELGYTGDMNDSAKMNIWLHKQVMNKLAANGGKVPADLGTRILDPVRRQHRARLCRALFFMAVRSSSSRSRTLNERLTAPLY